MPRICSNSRATRRPAPSLPLVITRKCGLRISRHGFSSPAADSVSATTTHNPTISFAWIDIVSR
jgi:hypothetical protein